MKTPTAAVSVRGLSKSFRVYEQPLDRLLEGLTRRVRHRVFPALTNVSLEIGRGETVGIVGRNGSGKSTLLQLIAGTLQPTTGHVEVHGRVAALLELGSGFNPEFTGRENVFLNAQVMGLRHAEVEQRFDRIERFADIGNFIDQPVRTYSSGMLVRLAFAVAINTDPDILIIDEALAVGDEAFQRKCFARIEEIKDAGATILFVSHAASSVINLCDRAVLLDGGERLLTGRPKDVISRYQRLLHSPDGQRETMRSQIKAFDREDAPGRELVEELSGLGGREPESEIAGASGMRRPDIGPSPTDATERLDVGLVPESTIEFICQGARISDPHIVSAQGQRVNVLLPGQPYTYRFRVSFEADAHAVEFGMSIKSIDGVLLFGMSSHGRQGFLPHVAAGTTIEVEYRFLSRFQPGTYFLNAGCQGVRPGQAHREFLHRIMDAACFRIEAATSDRYLIGFYDLSCEPSAAWRRVDDAGTPA